MTWPAHWPQDVPSPVLRGDGVWLTPRRLMVICKTHNPQPDDLQWRGKSWACRQCKLETERRHRAAERAALEAAQEAAQQELSDAEREQALADAREERKAPPSPFDFTRRRLEQEWGLPFAAWTRRHHQIHTRMIYHVLGWGDAAIREPVVGRSGLKGQGIRSPEVRKIG